MVVKVEKLNVNKYFFFCVKNWENLEYFLISSMKILKIRKYLIVNRNLCGVFGHNEYMNMVLWKW